MTVTLSEFVVKSLIESKSIDLIYDDPVNFIDFLDSLRPASKIYGVHRALTSVLNDGSAEKFVDLYEDVCTIVAGFGITKTPLTKAEIREMVNAVMLQQTPFLTHPANLKITYARDMFATVMH